mmetsp:Transcript_22641/g.33426  ORF Transcript_22641/g.33426 Transcript_22641/m.33426 type:complete len:349 (+) Transcript_22641:70-1116(+)
MYGGLFGDLPSATKSETEGGKEGESVVQMPKEVKEIRSDESKKQASSLLSGLGNAGTSMAFVPTAVRPRKRPRPPASIIKVKTTQSKVVRRQTTPSVISMQSQEASEPGLTSEIKISKEKSAVVNEAINKTENYDEEAFPRSMEEKKELQELHNSVTDAYDPFLPNDLLAYWEQKKVEEERLKLEKEARETLERQRLLRQHLEEERQKIEKSGSIKAIIEHRTKATLSLGRGRGVNNLPAWLLRKQKEELGKGHESPHDSIAQRTVILSNLTAPNDIDEDLVHEVREECEDQCGPVEDVQVKDSSPPHQPAVEAIVKFKSIGDAVKAEKLFHGRVFGTRKITARRLQN